MDDYVLNILHKHGKPRESLNLSFDGGSDVHENSCGNERSPRIGRGEAGSRRSLGKSEAVRWPSSWKGDLEERCQSEETDQKRSWKKSAEETGGVPAQSGLRWGSGWIARARMKRRTTTKEEETTRRKEETPRGKAEDGDGR